MTPPPGSPRIAGNDAFAGKYAKKPGCCQCVIPGRITRSRSASTASNGSPRSGGDSGSPARPAVRFPDHRARVCPSAVGSYGEGERAHRTAFSALKHAREGW